jgi:hypothetical protein
MLSAPSRAAFVADAGGGKSGEAALAEAAEAAAADPLQAETEVAAADPPPAPPWQATGKGGKCGVRA